MKENNGKFNKISNNKEILIVYNLKFLLKDLM